MDFLKKRWIRNVGVIPMTIYSLLAIFSIYAVLNQTVFRPPNQVFAMTDLIGWIGYFFFLGGIAGSGILAIVTAYYIRGVFKILYFAGILAILSSTSYLPLSFTFNADVDFHPEIPGSQFLVGTWVDDDHNLELFSDGTYILNCNYSFFLWSDSAHYEGEWKLESNYLYLSTETSRTWEVTKSDGFHFITYNIPDNFDAWTGYLGLMRLSDWEKNF